ncbi:hypothetical protein GYMLUDRAFT_40512 [Collybiopsis luxurians FD-317 M1]|uniref:Uncharacterized protein n=1 Tax=Collybiopsis luxurians FD-317 M1 TaxID=944289 RepID=A0A0D0CWI8_9AGAR|nr:hypothetical protein GYMLUDRAFT_40512 [Collybiopsis luxurians FD-317 M1]
MAGIGPPQRQSEPQANISQQNPARNSHPVADGNSDFDTQLSSSGPVNGNNLSTESYSGSECRDPFQNGNRYQKMAQSGYSGGEEMEGEGISGVAVASGSAPDTSSPALTRKPTRRTSNASGRSSSPLNLHRAGLLQAMASPYSYEANEVQNSPPPTFASLISPSFMGEASPSTTSGASSSSSGSIFISSSAQNTPGGTPASFSDGGVGHARPRGTASRAVTHSQNTIRDSTMELSGMTISSVVTPASFPSTYHSQSQSGWMPSTLTPRSFGAFDSTIRVEPRSLNATGDSGQHSKPDPSALDSATGGEEGSAEGSQDTGGPSASETPAGQFKSGLSLLLNSSSPQVTSSLPSSRLPSQPSRASSQSSVRTVTPSPPSDASEQDSSPEDCSGSPTPTSTRVGSPYPSAPILPHPTSPSLKNQTTSEDGVRPAFAARKSRIRWDPALDASAPNANHSHNSAAATCGANETTSLLCESSSAPFSTSSYHGTVHSRKSKSAAVLNSVKIQAILRDTARASLWAIPAVLLGCLLNILDGVSYGMIIFPTSAPFTTLGPMGVSMFFVSCVIAQLCYTFGGSGFAGANGSMMIEVVPFFHILASSIAHEIGEDNAAEVIATTIVSYALSSVLTGLSFLLLGALKLGALITFFPRHILVGCIGGVGAFLIETGLTVSMGIPDDDFIIDLETLKLMFFDPHNLALWTIPLSLAILLRVITSRWSHQLIFPVYFVIIPMLFYIIVAAARLNLDELRHAGWLFDIPGGDDGQAENWWRFYTYFDWKLIHLGPLWSTLPTQFALLFFNILHPPLNVPALSVSLDEDVDTNRELVAHGYSNIMAGAFGTVPNYLVYVNTLLFYRVGGGTRIAGFLLAVATAVLLLVGTGPIAYIPVPVVGALIFVLGIDLVKEALWDTRHRVSRTEYITIFSIIVAMTVWDFVIGVLFGIVVSCFFFVVQNSQRRSIRAFHTGETAMSTVRRPSAQRAYLKEVSKQTTVLRLQGFLFFGTITYVEEAIRNIIDAPSWQRNPVRFLVVDLTLVAGVDMSAAEAFVRIQRFLAAKYVTLVFCGFEVDSAVGKALESVGVMGAHGVELFSTFNDAMEWTENAYLKAFFRFQKSEMKIPFVLPGRQDVDVISSYQSSPAKGSPRRSMLLDVGARTIANDTSLPSLRDDTNAEPLATLVRAFSSFGDIDYNHFRLIVPYLHRMSVPRDYVLWRQGDMSDGLYLIESGVLRATYQFAEYTQSIEESMVPGTLAGELSALSSLPRNATVITERPAVLWKLSIEKMRRLEVEEPTVARAFTHMVLKSCKIDYDTLLAALATRQ